MNAALMLDGLPIYGADTIESQKEKIIDIVDADVFIAVCSHCVEDELELFDYLTRIEELGIEPKSINISDDPDWGGEYPKFLSQMVKKNKKGVRDNRKSVYCDRYLYQLFYTYQCFQMVKAWPVDYDYVIRSRIDMKIVEEMPELERFDNDKLYVPSIVHDRTDFDRFAVGAMEVMEHYANRFLYVQEYPGPNSKDRLGTPERELIYTMEKLGIQMKSFRMKMKRYNQNHFPYI